MLDKFGSRSLTAWFERPVLWRSFLTHSLCCSHSPVNAYETPKIGLRFMYQSTPTVIFWLGKKLSNCILCLKYLTYEEGIFPNHWSEYFEHSTHTNSKQKWSPFCAPAGEHFWLCNFPREWRSATESSVWNTSLMNELFFTLTEVIFLSFKRI